MSNSGPPPVARLAGKGGRYHHGRLRGALIVAAARILEAEGTEALTLRRLADVAGVSRTAPYRHFADKGALVQAVVGEGFAALSRELADAASAETDRGGRARVMAATYLAFARRHAAVFGLMFAGDMDDDGEAAVRRCFADALGDGAAAPAVRALVHGLAVLAPADGDPDTAEHAVAALLSGFGARA